MVTPSNTKRAGHRAPHSPYTQPLLLLMLKRGQYETFNETLKWNCLSGLDKETDKQQQQNHLESELR